MNKERRKELAEIAVQLDELTELAGAIRERLETVRDEEQEYFDNMPEGLQGGEKGETAQWAIDAIETVLSAVEEVESADFSGLADL